MIDLFAAMKNRKYIRNRGYGGIFLVIEATEGQSNGVSRAHSKASGIKLVEEPNVSAPKIFFRYYVNSSTGEKSGTMLAECKWTAADAGGEP